MLTAGSPGAANWLPVESWVSVTSCRNRRNLLSTLMGGRGGAWKSNPNLESCFPPQTQASPFICHWPGASQPCEQPWQPGHRGPSAFELAVVGVQLSPACMCSPWPHIQQWSSSKAGGQAENGRPVSQKNMDYMAASHSLTTVLSTESPGSSKGRQRYWNYYYWKITLKVKTP